MAHYLDDSTYHRLVDALSQLQPDPFTGRIDRDEIVTALGEIGDLWPAAIIPDVARALWLENHPGDARWLACAVAE